jgi:alanine racemase
MSSKSDPRWTTWFEIDLAAVRRNLARVRSIVGKRVKVAPVVKADAYGHGATQVARALTGLCDFLCVARASEGIELRGAGITDDILVMGESLPSQAPEIVGNDLVQTISGVEMAQALSAAALRLAATARVHLKVDTGMGRLGVMADEAADEAKRICGLAGVKLEGISSHFSTGATDLEFARKQLASFGACLKEIETVGVCSGLRHMANSAAVLNLPQAHLDMVRVGLAIYGLSPTKQAARELGLEPALSWKARVVLCKRVPAGWPVSYNRSFTTARPSNLAVLGVGYADGYSRALSNKGTILVRGRRFPVVGAVCMDQMVVDLGEERGESGEEAVLIGRQESEEVTANGLAELLGTTVHEVVARLGKRPPRVWIDEE